MTGRYAQFDWQVRVGPHRLRTDWTLSNAPLRRVLYSIWRWWSVGPAAPRRVI
ncbi:MAG: hypothetical protein CM15mP74_20240 [Halieaceae bacterium]|nr:MAG: hypothetical protein CM15mP74_20240 [Halieaceae bacterium]